MKKLIAIAALLCMLLTCQLASADGPVNPYFYDAIVPQDVRYGIMPAGDMTLSITTVEEPAAGKAGKWQMTASGGSAPYSYQYYILTEDWDTNGYFTWSDSDVCTYEFVTPGKYMLLAYAKDSTGATATQVVQFEVTGGMTVAEKVTQLVAECKAAGNSSDFDIALWLHDC